MPENTPEELQIAAVTQVMDDTRVAEGVGDGADTLDADGLAEYLKVPQ